MQKHTFPRTDTLHCHNQTFLLRACVCVCVCWLVGVRASSSSSARNPSNRCCDEAWCCKSYWNQAKWFTRFRFFPSSSSAVAFSSHTKWQSIHPSIHPPVQSIEIEYRRHEPPVECLIRASVYCTFPLARAMCAINYSTVSHPQLDLEEGMKIALGVDDRGERGSGWWWGRYACKPSVTFFWSSSVYWTNCLMVYSANLLHAGRRLLSRMTSAHLTDTL